MLLLFSQATFIHKKFIEWFTVLLFAHISTDKQNTATHNNTLDKLFQFWSCVYETKHVHPVQLKIATGAEPQNTDQMYSLISL